MDNLQWFKFSPAEWMMGRIQRLPPQVQVDFIRLCCKYWQKECELTIDDAQLEAMESYETLLKHRIITEEDECVRVAFLDEQMEGINTKREQARNAGKRSAESRKRSTKTNDRSTAVQRPFNDRSIPLNENEQRREEKIKRREDKDTVVVSEPETLNLNQTTQADETKPMTAKQFIEYIFTQKHTILEHYQRSSARDLGWVRGKGGVFYQQQINLEGDPVKRFTEWKRHFANFINRVKNEK